MREKWALRGAASGTGDRVRNGCKDRVMALKSHSLAVMSSDAVIRRLADGSSARHVTCRLWCAPSVASLWIGKWVMDTCGWVGLGCGAGGRLGPRSWSSSLLELWFSSSSSLESSRIFGSMRGRPFFCSDDDILGGGGESSTDAVLRCALCGAGEAGAGFSVDGCSTGGSDAGGCDAGGGDASGGGDRERFRLEEFSYCL